MQVCISCHDSSPACIWSGEVWVHQKCGGRLTPSPRNWSPPKKTNKRAWKRIEKGEWLWDRRRVKRSWKNRGPKKDTCVVYQTEVVEKEVESWLSGGTMIVKVKQKIPGTEREVTDFRKKPEVDLGG